ncbi:MAG: molybdopterin-containing oxidoreductase family protein [Solirubrobacteraceae bacterium]
MERELHRTFCRLCNAACGAVIAVEGDRVVGVHGDRAHPVSRGYLCPKGRALGAVHHHPARLNHPLMRDEGKLATVSWEDALGDLAERISSAIAKTGPSAIAMYKGTAHYAESAAVGMGPKLLKALGSAGWYTSLTVDCPAVTLVAELVVGHPWLLPVPDVDARLTVLVGTNPIASHGHTCNLPRPKEWLRRWARQGELWVIDPRRTESADVATAHLAPRPGSDHLLLAHLVRELLLDGADRAYLERHAAGVHELTSAVEPFTLKRVVRGTGVAASQVTELLEAIRATGRVAVVTGTGLNFSELANLSVWLAWMVSAVTGSLDRPGGMWFNPGYLSRTDRQTWRPGDGAPAPGPASRPDLPGRFGELPCAAIADEIESGNIRAMVILGGNPLIAWPQPERVAAALSSLDALAVIDVIHNEVGSLATHLLPASGQLERADVPTGSEVYALRSFSQYTEAVLDPVAERRPAWWIIAQLARRLGVDLMDDLNPDTATEEDVLRAAYGSDEKRWRAMRAARSAVLAAERPYHWVHRKLPGERLRLAPKMLVEQLAGARDPEPSALMLVNRRLLRKTNSQLADGHGMRRPARAETLLHPDDAAEREIVDGAQIEITSAYGSMYANARLDDRASRGTVSTPHGFVESNATRLISGDDVDRMTGMPRMTGLPVTIAPA